jgi:uncharacterized protein (DUF983 family)
VIFRCPRCGVGPLFQGVLKLAPKCTACGLDLRPYDQGDGPAAFAIFIVGAIVVGGAMWLEFTFSPPLWVHAAIWIPLIFPLTILVIRIIKAVLVRQQYRHLPPQEASPDQPQ